MLLHNYVKKIFLNFHDFCFVQPVLSIINKLSGKIKNLDNKDVLFAIKNWILSMNNNNYYK